MDELFEEEEDGWIIKEPTREDLQESVYGCLLKLRQDVETRINIMKNQRRRHPSEQTALHGLQFMHEQLQQLHSDMDQLILKYQDEVETETDDHNNNNNNNHETIKNQIQEWKDEVDRVKAELEKVMEERKELEHRMLRTVDELRQQQQSLQADYELQLEECKSLQDKNEWLCCALEKVQARANALQHLEQEQEQREEASSATLHQYCLEKHQKLETELESLQKERNELQTELELLQATEQEQQAQFTTTLSTLREQIEQIKQEAHEERDEHHQQLVSSLQTERDSLQSERADLCKELETLRLELEQIKETHGEIIQTQHSEFQLQLENVQAQLQKVLEELDAEKVVYSALRAEHDTLQEEYEKLQKDQETEEVWKKKVARVHKELRRVQQELLQEQEKVKHQEESFRSHVQSMAEMDEEVQRVTGKNRELETEKSELKQAASRYRALLKQMNTTLKQERATWEEGKQQHQQQESDLRKTIGSLEAQLQEQTAATARTSAALTSLSRSYCIHSILDLLAQNTAVLKLGGGQRPIFFPLLIQYRVASAVPSRQELCFLLELLRVLAFDLYCNKTSLLPGSNNDVHLLIAKKDVQDKTITPYAQMAKLFFCVYALAVEPLLQALAAIVPQLCPEDKQYLAQQLEEMFRKLFQSSTGMIMDTSTVLYLSDRDLIDVGAVALSAQPLSVFLPLLTRQLREDTFSELQPSSVAKTLSARLQSVEETWFGDTLKDVATALLNTIPDSSPFPTLMTSKEHGFPPISSQFCNGEDTPENRIQGHSRKLLSSLQQAVISNNQMLWDRMASELLMLHKNGRDVHLLSGTDLLTIIQRARTQKMHLRDIATLIPYIKTST